MVRALRGRRIYRYLFIFGFALYHIWILGSFGSTLDYGTRTIQLNSPATLIVYIFVLFHLTSGRSGNTLSESENDEKSNTPRASAAFNLKSLTLISNTALVLATAWAYVKGIDVVPLITLVISAGLNAYLLLSSYSNKELTSWVSYSVNLYLLAAGLWIFDEYGLYSRGYIGIAIGLIALINIVYRYSLREGRSNQENPQNLTGSNNHINTKTDN